MERPNPWTLLLEPKLNQRTDHALLLYISAMNVPDPEPFLKRLEVVWIWQLKNTTKPFHEVCVIETVDHSDNNKSREFVLDRVYDSDHVSDPLENVEV
jgi:hypothetical protein